MTLEELCFFMEMELSSIKYHPPGRLDLRLKTVVSARCWAHLLCTLLLKQRRE